MRPAEGSSLFRSYARQPQPHRPFLHLVQVSFDLSPSFGIDLRVLRHEAQEREHRRLVAAGPAPAGPSAPQAGPFTERAGRMNMPKDVQDRMTFDAQAALFFSYLVQKAGLEKTKELVQWNREGKPSREFLARAEVLGSDLEKIEHDWLEWVKQQKMEGPNMRLMTSPARPSPPQ